MFLTGTQNEWDLLMAASALFTLPLVIIFFWHKNRSWAVSSPHRV